MAVDTSQHAFLASKPLLWLQLWERQGLPSSLSVPPFMNQKNLKSSLISVVSQFLKILSLVPPRDNSTCVTLKRVNMKRPLEDDGEWTGGESAEFQVAQPSRTRPRVKFLTPWGLPIPLP